MTVDNTLGRRFDVDAADQFWVTDIAYIKTHEGFSYLAVVIDLFSRQVVALSWFVPNHCRVTDGRCDHARQRNTSNSSKSRNANTLETACYRLSILNGSKN